MNSSYELDLPKIGIVKVTKKRGQSSLRIRLSSKGEVLVSVPYLTPKIVVEQFVKSRIIWILNNRPNYDLKFSHGMKLKSGIVLGIYDYQPKNRSKLLADRLNIYINGAFNPDDPKQHNYIEKKIIDAMKKRAENTLLPKLLEIASSTGHEFNQAYVKALQSRWGSCDSSRNITLNIYMLQLPENLQRYVILHELTHTLHMNHSSKFWAHLESLMPDYKQARKTLKSHHTRIESA